MSTTASAGRGGSGSKLPRGCLVLLLVWLALACGGLVIAGLMTLLGAIGSLGIGEGAGAFALRLVSGMIFMALAAGAFLVLLRVVAGVRVGAQAGHLAEELAELGLQPMKHRGFASLSGVGYEGTDREGRGIFCYVRGITRRGVNRRLRTIGMQIELFLEHDNATRCVVTRPQSAKARALSRLNRRFGLQPVETRAATLEGRAVWALDPYWAGRLLAQPAVLSAIDTLVPSVEVHSGAAANTALHVQPQSLYWVARTKESSSVAQRVAQGLEMLQVVAAGAEDIGRPREETPEGSWERRSRRDRGSIANWTVLGCMLALGVLIALPLLLVSLVAVTMRAAGGG